MHEDDLDIYYADAKRVDVVLRRQEMIMPYTTENVSCDRLMRVKAGVHHHSNECYSSYGKQK